MSECKRQSVTNYRVNDRLYIKTGDGMPASEVNEERPYYFPERFYTRHQLLEFATCLVECLRDANAEEDYQLHIEKECQRSELIQIEQEEWAARAFERATARAFERADHQRSEAKEIGLVNSATD